MFTTPQLEQFTYLIYEKLRRRLTDFDQGLVYGGTLERKNAVLLRLFGQK